MVQYIMIMEGGEIYKSKTLTEDDKTSADNGILDIIDIKTMKQYYEGEWHEMQVWGEW